MQPISHRSRFYPPESPKKDRHDTQGVYQHSSPLVKMNDQSLRHLDDSLQRLRSLSDSLQGSGDKVCLYDTRWLCIL
ncbi:hypothetical protein SERLA73DRAFT_178555 [Serpula lacrymans var. lacrymans S7.3]|uniref:Uncharacterized protein n=2 Tax=Serpula lacrymans var. lacrymans TaxID=341189 RepID=F8PS12_SERL3|nr:uncharacterized protein SERLADRAFT_463048 [Serpula lacrymans var. lacrymans S7.9]EGO00678.1 hypothetical protein SERLA73DRAFT_178555 [Serpula lacrymans var. lacrymans S7.3]EGO26230.1 hypothetical protein SERLADRAFT_463048 [Serpula lacrymans var. lacrymans S7.9]